MADINPFVGNEEVASDLYGNGFRIGLYLQSLGLLLCGIRGKSRGVKLTCGPFLIALLASFTSLARSRAISPAEGAVILLLASILGSTAAPAAGHPDAIVGEGVASFSLILALVWLVVMYILYWAKLSLVLPDLGTTGDTWFFVKVKIAGWFRIFMLVQGCISMPLSALATIWFGLATIVIGGKAWRSGEDVDMSPAERERAVLFSRAGAVLGLITFIFAIAGVEMTIRWNGLVPQDDISRPGQVVPLVIGIFVLADGFMSIWTSAERD